ncbi:hypothetical protein EDD21DRAFT_420963 [Dissophora ornata]|nr:hypothetical protein EDD21DRAFT_420963 [Dissophora ornata]
MSNYGTNNHSHGRDEENQALLNGTPIAVVEIDTFYGRTFHHVRTHRKRYFFLWFVALISAVSIVLGLYHYEKNKHEGGGEGGEGDLSAVCQSDRSYPIAILLSIFFGYVG